MDIGTLVMKINADTEQAEKNLAGVQKAIGGFAKVAGAAALVVGGALAVALKDGVDGLIAMEDQTAQLDAVLKSTGGAAGWTAEQAIALSEAYQKTTKFAAESVLEGQNLLLTFTNIGEDVFPQATQTLLDMATALGTDAAGSAIQLGKALNDPITGISALSRVGVTFSEEQKATIQTMVDLGDTAGAQKVILAELSKEFGGSAEAAGKTFSGQIEIAKNAIGELNEGLAAQLMPSLISVLDWVNANMPTIQLVMQTVFDAVGSAITIATDLFSTYLLPTITKVYDFIVENWPAMQKSFETVFSAITAAGKEFWTFFGENIMPILNTFVDYIIENWPAIQKTFEDVFGLMTDAVKLLWDTFKWMWEFLEPTFPLIGAVAEAAFKVVGDNIRLVIDTIKTLVAWIKDAIEWFDKLNTKKAGQTGAAGGGLGLNTSRLVNGKVTGSLPVGTLRSEANPTGQQRAFGGSVMAGKSYLVGERGAETFTPSTNGTVSPSAGNSVIININGAQDTNAIMNQVVRMLKQNKVIPV